MRTVRDACIEILRSADAMTWYGNPGSTELPLLLGLPEDVKFVLALHEGSAVGMAAGHAHANAGPGIAVLHSLAGAANAMGALSTAAQGRLPLVAFVGQQHRRHLHMDPFLSGRLSWLEGPYLKRVFEPACAEAVPTVLAQALIYAQEPPAGPVALVVPMDDWGRSAGPVTPLKPPTRRRSSAAPSSAIMEVAERLRRSESPVIVVGPGMESDDDWQAVQVLAEVIGANVWLEPFSPRAGFPQSHVAFQGMLPGRRGALRQILSEHDVLLAFGADVFRYYQYEDGPLFVDGLDLIQVTPDPLVAARLAIGTSFACGIAVLAEGVASELKGGSYARDHSGRQTGFARENVDRTASQDGRTAASRQVRAGDVFEALADWLPTDAIVFGESPSTQTGLRERMPTSTWPGFLAAAGGALGFAVPAAVGLQMAVPNRQVVVVCGDGSFLYSPQALWTAAHYRVPITVLVMRNGSYAILERASEQYEPPTTLPWPRIGSMDPAGMARSMGCPAVTVQTVQQLSEALDQQRAQDRDGPLLIDVQLHEHGDQA